jgi:hypothetical protein
VVVRVKRRKLVSTKDLVCLAEARDEEKKERNRSRA